MTTLTPERDEYDFGAAIWDYLERTQHFRCDSWSFDPREPEVLLCGCGEDVMVPGGVL